MKHKRTRHQSGSLTIEKRSNGPDVWVFRWREKQPNGTRVKRKEILGTKAEYPSKAAAQRKADVLRVRINAPSHSVERGMTVGSLIEHYKSGELTKSGKTASTIAVYRHHLDSVIAPRWAGVFIGDLRPIEVERWLQSLPGAPSTKSKTKNVFSVVYQHAVRHGFMTINPITAVRQSSLRLREPDVLTVAEVKAILSDLPQPCLTAAQIAATTGLRRGEIFGLRWEDIDFERGLLHVKRSIVNQVQGEPKTVGSKKPLPLDSMTLTLLSEWRRQSSFSKAGDWVFASPASLGRNPYAPKTQLDRHIIPAARRAGIEKQIGWHTFRRTFATLLQSEGANVKVSQELMRHASPVMTMGTYAQAITEEKRAAQGSVAALFHSHRELNGPQWPFANAIVP